MKKRIQTFTIVCFALFLCATADNAALRPGRTYSYFENRSLAPMPEISLAGVLDGCFQSALDRYLTDQAPARTYLLAGKTALDEFVLRRPVVNTVVVRNDILLPYNEYWGVDAQWIGAQARDYAASLSALNDQIAAYGGHYLHVAVPCQYAYFEDKYPWYLENRALYTDVSVPALSQALAEEGVAFLDMTAVADAQGHPLRFGSTVDNHFSIYGAYMTYAAIIDRLNEQTGAALRCPAGDEISFRELPNPYTGSRTRMLYGLTAVKDRLSIAEFAAEIPFTREDNGAPVEPRVYPSLIDDPAAALSYDIYMGGDIGRTVIDTGRPELPSVLIYGDSFTNAVESLLYYSFDKTTSIDLRHYHEMSLADYIAETKPDYVICIRDYEALLSAKGNGSVFGTP